MTAPLVLARNHKKIPAAITRVYTVVTSWRIYNLEVHENVSCGDRLRSELVQDRQVRPIIAPR